jgi:hypothetical protein
VIIGGMALFVLLDVIRSVTRRRRSHGDA